MATASSLLCVKRSKSAGADRQPATVPTVYTEDRAPKRVASFSAPPIVRWTKAPNSRGEPLMTFRSTN
eukprot:5100886-Prymnesium_polylepis.1